MAITATISPAALTWAHFRTSPTQILDPNDGTLQDALTRFDFNMPDLGHRLDGKQFALADPNVITITPNAQVWTGVAQTAALLSHEQFHYDVGFVTARALARELTRLRAPSLAALTTAFRTAVQLHLFTRAGLLQRRYDLDTSHGTVAHYQRIWKDRMTACLADANATQLGGFWL